MFKFYLWHEIEAPDIRSATANGLVMASVIRGARLVHVQSKVSKEISDDERAAAQRNRRLKIADTDEDNAA